MGLNIETRARLEQIVRNYLETATRWGQCARPSQIRAAAKNMVQSGRLPVRVIDAIRQQSAAAVGQLGSGPQGVGRASGGGRVEPGDGLQAPAPESEPESEPGKEAADEPLIEQSA